MANSMAMASSFSKTLVPTMGVGPTKQCQSAPLISIPTKKPLTIPSVKSTAAAIATAAGGFFLAASPSLAAEIEKAALFDFNLTLPVIMAEFLLLMVTLDKIYYTPLGKFMDERDAAIREKLNSVKDTSGEVKQLEDQAAAVMRAARAEISAALNKMKKETSRELELKLAEGRKKVEAELAEALKNLERQKEDTIKALDSQIAALSDGIVKKVLPIN
ncbi:ATP synthase subunit b', chloroplastic [Magnolia sinica]|uniref:ATP synthase subunit b', chloroplastic n=1 Tax=Magnolia sinica TaxID=86752 RepID=UPI00265987E6|nr:ATP synthase subunit b', chloroplastic [Magnolia sinica]